MASEYTRQMEAKWGPFVVTRYDANAMRSVAIPGHVYATMDEAVAAAVRLERGKRYADKPSLLIDSARFYAA